MKKYCPFSQIIRIPDYQSTNPRNSLKVLKEESLGNGYRQLLTCKCPECGKEFIVEGLHNPYYESWHWPEKAACEE